MAMTERQGGSDVRANETTARSEGDAWILDGHKWFCSAPMSDAFLVLAQAPAGLSCFLVERPQAGFRIERLKDKLGNRSNASAEIALDGAVAGLVGAEGRGLHTILEMVNHTRLDCVLGSTALMRRAVAEATHHAAHRSAFGRMLAEQPLMRNVLADLCVESEAATVTALRLARAFDEADVPFRRLATAVAKFWICKRTPPLVAEALECLGGNGFVEESQLRASSARARSTRSGRDPATSTPSTSCARSPVSPRPGPRTSPKFGLPRAPTRAWIWRSRDSSESSAEPEEEGARGSLELLAVSL